MWERDVSNKLYLNSHWCPYQRGNTFELHQTNSKWHRLSLYLVYNRYIPKCFSQDVPVNFLVYTRYIPGICHLESCTPGQDQAKWHTPVSTSTYQYNMVQVSTRFPHRYETVCTSTYQYMLSTRYVVFSTHQ